MASAPVNTTSSERGRIVGADGVRALACLWVFACHVVVRQPGELIHGRPVGQLAAAGYHGVAVFFVLSGFLLSLPFWKRLRDGRAMPSLRTYTRRRAARIIPEFVVCVLVTAWLAGAFSSKWGLMQVAACLTFTGSLLPPFYTPAFNPPLWSIGIEAIFYALLPVALWPVFRWGGTRRAVAWVVGLIGLIAAGQVWLLHAAPAIERLVGEPALFSAETASTRKNAVAMFAHFLIGSLGGLAHASWPVPRRGRWAWDAAAVVAAVVLLLPLIRPLYPLPHVAALSYAFPFASLATAALLVSLPRSTVAGRLLDVAPLRLTAAWSYGLYIWHAPILTAVLSAWPRDERGVSVMLPAAVAVALGLSYAVAGVSYVLIGRPAMRWAARRQTPAAPLPAWFSLPQPKRVPAPDRRAA